MAARDGTFSQLTAWSSLAKRFDEGSRRPG